MSDFANIALIGLLFLIPSEIFFLIVLSAYTKRLPKAKIVNYQPKKPQRYGWQDYLNLPIEKPQTTEQKYKKPLIAVVVIALILLIAVLSLLSSQIPISTIGSLFNGSNNSQQETIDMEPDAPEQIKKNNATGRQPLLNFSFQPINISAMLENVDTSYLPILGSGVVFFLLAVVFLAFTIGRGRHAIIKKARKTADKLIEKSSKKPKKRKDYKVYFKPMVVLLFLIIAAVLVYFLRDKIRNELADIVLNLYSQASSFVSMYYLYIITGFVILAVIIFALKRLQKRK